MIKLCLGESKVLVSRCCLQNKNISCHLLGLVFMFCQKNALPSDSFEPHSMGLTQAGQDNELI